MDSGVLIVVSNKEKCDISFPVCHGFSLEICLLMLHGSNLKIW